MRKVRTRTLLAALVAGALVLPFVGVVAPASASSPGQVMTVGRNNLDQLGVPNPPGATATWQSAFPNATAVSAGNGHSIALKADGTVWAWGDNEFAQLGNGAGGGSPVYTPAQVVGLSGIKAISAGGEHNLALDANGHVWAWGADYYGQLGTSAVNSPGCFAGWACDATPVEVTGANNAVLSNIVAISAGGFHNLAIDRLGTLWSWGYNAYGQLGIPGVAGCNMNGSCSTAVSGPSNSCFGTSPCSATPMQVPGLADVTSISAGGYHSLAVVGGVPGSGSAGVVFAWGLNDSGELGVGTNVVLQQCGDTSPGTTGSYPCSSVPLPVPMPVVAPAATLQGPICVSGLPFLGSVCTPPVTQTAVSGVVSVSAGHNHSLALGADGTVWAWGLDAFGQLGNDGVDNLKPEAGLNPQLCDNVNTNVGVSSIFPTLTLPVSFAAPCSPVPVPVLAPGATLQGPICVTGIPFVGSVCTPPVTPPLTVLTGVVSISAGYFHNLALKSDGSVVGWGLATFGELGATGFQTQCPQSNWCSPVAIPVWGVAGVSAISGGSYHSMVLE